ncbi:MAG: PAS domain S-box protein [Desulfobulbus sp.]|nr:PAS domain S-box protein [Desulfobulbus sp.]
MTQHNPLLSTGEQLRHKAERLAQTLSPITEFYPAKDAVRDIQALLHELSVHQIELEMQNEELRRVHDELDASRARYFDLFELAPVGYLTVSVDGVIQEGNLTAATLLGLPRSSFIGLPFSRFVHPIDVDCFHRKRAKAIGVAESLLCEIRIIRPDQTVLWSQLVIKSQQQDDGSRVSRLILSDISNRKGLEVALYESEERYRSLFELASDALIVIDSECGWIIDANTRALELYRYSKKDLDGLRCWDLCANEESSSWLTVETLAHPDGVRDVSLHQHKRKDGTVFPAEITARVLMWGGAAVFFHGCPRYHRAGLCRSGHGCPHAAVEIGRHLAPGQPAAGNP